MCVISDFGSKLKVETGKLSIESQVVEVSRVKRPRSFPCRSDDADEGRLWGRRVPRGVVGDTAPAEAQV